MVKQLKYRLCIFLGILFLCFSGCKKWLPEDLAYLSPEAVFTQTEFHPVLGRTTEYSRVFNTDNSNTPIHFEITNVRYKSTGEPTDDLEKVVPVWVWKKAYTGYEKSLEEINDKREKEEHPLWEIRKTSGDFILWASADSTMMRQQPDSGYYFDVIASNSGGEKTYEDLILDPFRARPYEPYEYDEITGERNKKYPNPADSSVFRLEYVHPRLHNIVGDSTDLPMESDSVRTYFHRKGDGHKLTFKFLNKDSLPINPSMFNLTVWDSVVHGFNKVLTDTDVTYDVAYPIPLVKYPTRFTNSNGSEASVQFSFNRIGFGNRRQTCSLTFNFAIYKPGDWEIIFHFYDDNPKFRNE